MKVLLIEPYQVPKVKEIGDDLKSMQAIVGGTIEAVYPFADAVALVCNDEAKLIGLPLNRALLDEKSGQVYDVIAGTFFLCGAPADSDSFASLTEEQIEKFSKRFAQPEWIIHVNGQLVVLRDE